MNFVEGPLSAGLYLVATPIGAARDITLRALDVLASADVILAEDTRTARKLMEIHGIRAGARPLLAYHDHSGTAVCDRAVDAIKAGKAVACMSEAGTPLVADPGYEVAQAVIAAGLPVMAVPGPSALLAALAVAGLPTDRFYFAGFLPAARARRQTEIAALRDVPGTLVFFESPRRVGEMLADLVQVLGTERQGAICRELTKRFEEVRRGRLGDLADALAGQELRGEVVVVIGRAGAAAPADDDVRSALEEAMRTMRMKDA
ncbi:MAG: 16S rRNA (cytidine(1402)-2'-O)-methyltransferase, partial [Rubellimicrobium sp.]|nr:16S rRNA (cytidine(1402)-2'-O)-methyltransferase [Rubellimicrobium sp.]